MMKRVLYFTGYRMVAQEWLGRHLQSSIYFEPDEQGLDLFSAYLRSFHHEPVRLLVDLIEEEFRQITIPMVRGSDRQAILNRNFTKFFRNSEFKFAVSQQVEKKARKEEKLLLIGLTNQSLLEPWLRIIDGTRTPLSGIISLPLLSENFVDQLDSDANAKILVSQEVPSNLRQSVFIDGKLILSRLVPITSFYQGDYAGDVVRDIESTQRYLISQRIVERSENVAVHILSNKRHQDKLKIKCDEENFLDVNIHEINELLADQKIQVGEPQDFSSALFCFLASKEVSLNHYAQPRQKKYYQHHKAGLILKIATFVILAVGIGYTASSVVKGILYNSTINNNALIERTYKAKFNQLNENKIRSTISATSMQHVVLTVEEIGNSFLHDPEEMLSLISRDISLFPELRVKDIDWFLSDISDAQSSTEASWNNQDSNRRYQRSGQGGQPRVRGFFEIANVKAEFLNFDGDFRYALSAVDDLEKTMSESGSYFHVEITRRPLDIETYNDLSGDLGGRSLSSRRLAELEFRLVRKVGNSE